MNYYISALVAGTDGFPEFAEWINSVGDRHLGVELTAFTHDDAYWGKLCDLMPRLSCPVTFHGPYVQIEATSDLNSEAHRWLMESYGRVFALAAKYHAGHVVFHYSQKQFAEDTRQQAQDNAYAVMKKLTAQASEQGVFCVIENLCRQKQGIHLFSNDEYNEIFQRIPQASALIDIGHAHVNGLDIERFLYTYRDRVKGFHIHNNDGRTDQHMDYHQGTADIRQIMHWAAVYTPHAHMVLEYEPHEHLSHTEFLEEIEELRGWVAEGK